MGKKLKKVLAILLAVSITMSMLTLPASAEEKIKDWWEGPAHFYQYRLCGDGGADYRIVYTLWGKGAANYNGYVNLYRRDLTQNSGGTKVAEDKATNLHNIGGEHTGMNFDSSNNWFYVETESKKYLGVTYRFDTQDGSDFGIHTLGVGSSSFNNKNTIPTMNVYMYPLTVPIGSCDMVSSVSQVSKVSTQKEQRYVEVLLDNQKVSQVNNGGNTWLYFPNRSGSSMAASDLNVSHKNQGKYYYAGIKVNEGTKTYQLDYRTRYTATFDSNGGSAVASQGTWYGGKVTKPANPSRIGYTFAGWTLNGKTYDFNAAVTGNITLTAQWQKNPVYTIVGHVDNGGHTDIDKIEVERTGNNTPLAESVMNFYAADGYYIRSAYGIWKSTNERINTFKTDYDLDHSNVNQRVWVWNATTGIIDDLDINVETLPHPDNAHRWSETVTKAATCEGTGLKSRVCTICNKTETGIEIPALGHTYGGWTQYGNETQHRKVCGRDASHVQYENHTWQESGRTTSGLVTTITYTCSVCGQTKTATDTHVHSYTETVTAPTCTEQGYTTHTCACGHSYTDTPVAALGHTGGTANCVDKAVCTRCGEGYGEMNAANHKSVVNDDAVAATCTATGLTAGSHCNACNTVIKAQTKTDALGHAWGEWQETQAPGCTTTGTKTRECSRCDATKGDTVPAAGHKWATNWIKDAAKHWHACTVCSAKNDEAGHTYGTWETVTEATEEQAGSRKHSCTVCGHTETGEIPKLEHTHKYTTETVVQPTCTEQGYTTHTCACGESYRDTYVDALGHTGGTANCMDKAVCDRCKQEYGTVNATNHKSVATDAAVEASCDKPGKTEGSHCDACHKTIVAQMVTGALGHDWGTPTYTWSADNSTCAAKAVCTRDASHTVEETVNSSKQTTKQPSYTEDGEDTYTADFIQAPFEDQTKTVTVPKKVCQHTNTEVRDAKEATCTEAGYTGDTYCTECSEKIATGTDTNALGHNWNITYTWSADNSTCTAQRVCGRDGSHIEEETVRSSKETVPSQCVADGNDKFTAAFENPAFATQTKTVPLSATGHTRAAAVRENERAATCTADGSYDEVVYCDVCHAELERRTVPVPATGHTPAADAAVAPTCTETGLTAGNHCSVCNEILTAQTVIPANGHSYGAWRTVTEPTTTSTGRQVSTCGVCGATRSRILARLTVEPTPTPTVEPTATPTLEPTVTPTATPTVEPTATPTVEPTATPTVEPTAEPTVEPTAEPAEEDLEDIEPPLADLPPEEEDLEDEEPPLADVPTTGDSWPVWIAMALSSGLGLFLLGRKKKEEN